MSDFKSITLLLMKLWEEARAEARLTASILSDNFQSSEVAGGGKRRDLRKKESLRGVKGKDKGDTPVKASASSGAPNKIRDKRPKLKRPLWIRSHFPKLIGALSLKELYFLSAGQVCHKLVITQAKI